MNFNPRSREGSDNKQIKEYKRYVNFNPRSREGSDESDMSFIILDLISIHAPAKGATKMIKKDKDIVKISIHAPAKGATDNKSKTENK